MGVPKHGSPNTPPEATAEQDLLLLHCFWKYAVWSDLQFVFDQSPHIVESVRPKLAEAIVNFCYCGHCKFNFCPSHAMPLVEPIAVAVALLSKL